MSIRLTPAVKALLIACFAAFIVQHTVDQFIGGDLQGWLALVPSGFVVGHRFWQILTYPFLHADVMHLFLNLMMLAFIGGELEAVWGTARFVRFFFLCTTSAGALYLLLQLFVWGGAGLQMPMMGASGGIYGLLMAYGLIFGERVLLFMMLFPMKAKHFVWILAAVEFMSTVFSGRGGLSGAAHLGGMAAGGAFLWGRAAWAVYKRRKGEEEAKRPKRRRGASDHLRLVVNRPGSRPGLGDDDDQKKGPGGGNPTTWH